MTLPRTRAKIQLTTWDIEQLLDLPEGYGVLYVGTEFDPSSIAVVVQSDELPPVDPACQLPLLHGAFSREDVVVDGKVYSRWAWSPTAEDDQP